MTDDGVNPAGIRTLFIGFSAAAQGAAETLLRQGQPRASLFVAARDASQQAAASQRRIECRVVSLPFGIEPLLRSRLTKVIVDVEDDDCAEAIIRLVRKRLRQARILVRGTCPAALGRFLASGASEAFCDASIAGKLLAATAMAPTQRVRALHS